MTSFPPRNLASVYVDWFDLSTEEHSSYESVPGSIRSNTRNRGVLFTVRPTDKRRDEDEFEMIVRQADATAVLKCSVFEDPEVEYEVPLLASTDELLVYYKDQDEHIYVHFRLARR